jgi:hypothetical protein
VNDEITQPKLRANYRDWMTVTMMEVMIMMIKITLFVVFVVIAVINVACDD